MEDDPIVEEIPIFNCSEMNGKSFIMQFPLIPRKNTLPNIQIASHDADSDQYYFIALPENGSFASAESSNFVIESQRIAVNQPIAIGILHEGQLHLTPITQVFQTRPTMKTEKDMESIPGVPIDWTELENPSQFISSSHDNLSSLMSVSMFQAKITDTNTSLNIDMFENMPESVIRSRPPHEQLFLKMIKDKTILFDDVIKQLDLKAYVDDLLETLLKHGYYVQGRWTIKPEEMPESMLPRNLRMARSFMIVLFANGKTLKHEMLPEFIKLFSLSISDGSLSKVLDGVGVNILKSKLISFRFKPRLTFEQDHPEISERAKAEINKLKETICMAKHNKNLFDQFLKD